MPLPLIVVMFLGAAIFENRRVYGKDEPMVLRAGQTLLIDDDGWRIIEAPRVIPVEPTLAIPPAPGR